MSPPVVELSATNSIDPPLGQIKVTVVLSKSVAKKGLPMSKQTEVIEPGPMVVWLSPCTLIFISVGVNPKAPLIT